MNMHSQYTISLPPITPHSKLKNEEYCKVNRPDIYNIINQYNGDTYIEKLYNLYYNSPSHQCQFCGSSTKFVNFSKGYAKYCSSGCASKDPNTKDKKLMTMRNRYGVDNPSQMEGNRDKVKSTLKSKYGDEKFNNRKKYEDTCIKIYGTAYPSQLEEIQNKICHTNINKYGVPYGLANKDIIKKADETYDLVYGGRGNKSNIILNKVKDTCKEKYGVDSYSQTDEYKQRVKDTCKEKYGVDSYSQTDEYKQRVKDTCREKYGVDSYSQTDECKQRVKDTCREKYGVDSYLQTDECKQRCDELYRQRILSKYTDINYIFEKDGCVYYNMSCGGCNQCNRGSYDVKSSNVSDRRRHNLIICPYINPFSKINNTSIEDFVKKILNKYNIEYICNDRTILKGKELDIYIPDKHLAIECNGIYWHSTARSDKNRHIDKYNMCKNIGIQLLTLWEDQIRTMPDKITSMIESKLGIYSKTIYARSCVVKEINTADCNSFTEKYHIQGKINGKVRIGLYHGNELVSIMLFGKGRNCMKSKDTWELYRYCCKTGYHIVGGASKLFSYFIKKYHPCNIISFSSNDISSGKLYKILGFHQVSTTIGYWYIDSAFHRYHRYAFSKYNLIKKGYNPNKTESEIMKENGYFKIFDSGQTKWERI